MDKGAREEAIMELSESQIIQLWGLGSTSTSTTFATIADLSMRAGNLQEASSRARKRSSSVASYSKSGVRGDADWSASNSLDFALECFFVLGAIFSLYKI
jgi:hypothetical protein